IHLQASGAATAPIRPPAMSRIGTRLSLIQRKSLPAGRNAGKLGGMSPLVPSPDALVGMGLFSRLTRAAVAEVLARGRVRRLSKDRTVFAQGEAAEHCHALIEGRVRIAQSDEDGAQLVVRFIGPGEMFGTVALFTDRKYPAEAVAVVES